MPIIVTPLGFGAGNPLNHPTDGFDPTVPYQMIPLGQTRDMVVKTGDFRAELRLTGPGVSTMTNFQILSQSTPAPFPLPPPGVIQLPPRSVVKFTLTGQSRGFAVLEGRDLPAGAPPLRPDFKLLISVKLPLTRAFAVCYLFDRVNRDVGARRDFAGHLNTVHQAFHTQANISIINLDGLAASTAAARTLQLNGTMGRVFDLENFAMIGRIIDAFDSKFRGSLLQHTQSSSRSRCRSAWVRSRRNGSWASR